MGRAKAWLPWFGRTLIEHVVAQLLPVVDEVIVVTSEALDLPELPARVVRDREPERGPLAGLRDGLEAANSELVFVTGTDAPFLTSAFVAGMLERGRPCAPVAEGHVQVLCGVYPRSAGKQAARLLETGRSRPLELLESVGFEAIEWHPDAAGSRGGATERDLVAGAFATADPPPWRGFNTPQAYLAGVRSVDPEASAEVELLGRAALRVEQRWQRVPVGTLGEVLAVWPDSVGLVEDGQLARSHLASLGGRDLVRDLAVPVGPGERVSVLDSLAGG
jgi:molybdopterin-guanine dinucleotide biosynthesis protein A